MNPNELILPRVGGPLFRGATVLEHGGRRQYVCLAVLLAMFGLLQCLLPLGTAIQVGADEGFELAKATLGLNGYVLYTQVWNDQPPLHTFFVTQVLKLLSHSILGARAITLLSAVVLLGSVFMLSRRITGPVVATAATGLLLASPGFLELSSSCMLELPALAPALGAVCLLSVGRKRKLPVAELGSGVLFGVALLTKLVPAILLPIAGLMLSLQRARANAAHDAGLPQQRSTRDHEPCPRVGLILSLLIFATSALATFVAMEYLIDGGAYLRHFGQSWSSHFRAGPSTDYGSLQDHPFDWSILLKNWDATIAGAIGVRTCLQRRRRCPLVTIPVAWLALMLLVFAVHKPWWSYYYVHLAIPLSWCAAIGAESAWQWHRRVRHTGLSVVLAAFAICAAGWMAARVYFQISAIRHSPRTYSALVLDEITRMRGLTRFMYTDDPIYSFHAGIPLPPDLAVLPLKRFWSGNMSNARLAAELEDIKPEVILVRNSGSAVPFQELLDTTYRVVYQDADHRLYATRSVAKAAGY